MVNSSVTDGLTGKDKWRTILFTITEDLMGILLNN